MMKNLILLLTCASLCFSSCKKNNLVVADNTISAFVNGVEESFNIKAGASETVEDNVHILYIEGTSAAGESLSIEVNANSAITKGTYPVIAGVPNGFNAGTTIEYVDGYTQLFPVQSTASFNTITITYISNTVVQGTFDVTLSDSFRGGSITAFTNKTFTSGKFNVTIK